MRISSIVSVCMAAALFVTACGTSSSFEGSSADTAVTETSASGPFLEVDIETEPAAAPKRAFREEVIFEDQKLAFMNVSAEYSHPVICSCHDNDEGDYDLHLICDVFALDNDLGYGKGDWIPYLDIHYKVRDQKGKIVESGQLAPGNSSEGPHYGSNLSLSEAGRYSLELSFDSPEKYGYLIHVDEETGAGGLLEDYDWPLVLKYDNWNYIPPNW